MNTVNEPNCLVEVSDSRNRLWSSTLAIHCSTRLTSEARADTTPFCNLYPITLYIAHLVDPGKFFYAPWRARTYLLPESRCLLPRWPRYVQARQRGCRSTYCIRMYDLRRKLQASPQFEAESILSHCARIRRVISGASPSLPTQITLGAYTVRWVNHSQL